MARVVWIDQWSSDLPEKEGASIRFLFSRKALAEGSAEQKLDRKEWPKSRLANLLSYHSEKLPFLKKNEYKRKLRTMDPRLRRIAASEKGTYWNWKKNLLFTLKDPAHPKNIWKRQRFDVNLVTAPIFFTKRDREYLLKRYKRKNLYHFIKFSLNNNIEHSAILNDWGWQKDWLSRKKKFELSLFESYLSKVSTSAFKINRAHTASKNKFKMGAEGKPFWAVSWWKKPCAAYSSEWNHKKFALEMIKYADYRSANYSLGKGYTGGIGNPNNYLLRTAPKFLMFFYKKTFKLIYFQQFLELKESGFRELSNLFLKYTKFKIEYWDFFEGIKNFILKSSIRPAAYFLSNLSYTSILEDRKRNPFSGNLIPSYIFRNTLFRPSSQTLASSFGVHDGRTDSNAFFSNYLKINNYIIIKYFFYLMSARGAFANLDEKRDIKMKFKNFFNFIFFVSEKKYENLISSQSADDNLIRPDGTKNVTISTAKKNKKIMYKVFFTALSVLKNHFFESFPHSELWQVLKNPPRLEKKKYVKHLHLLKTRGIFYYKQKKLPLWCKSHKSIRLYKRFVRNYTPKKSKAFRNMVSVTGLAGRYFKITGCKKYFKQKIYIRAKFADHYRGSDRTKMNNRWKYIQKARHKWHGFYNEFEGTLLRASLWLGYSYKYKLSKFLVDNNLILINGGVGSAGARHPVRSGDIIHLRNDIYRHLMVKRELLLFKKYLSKMPFYSKFLKNKILFRISKLFNAKSLGRSSYKKKKLYKSVLKYFKEGYVNKAIAIGLRRYEKNQPGVILLHKKQKWHRRVKNFSSVKFLQNVLKRKSYISAFDDRHVDPLSESFLIKSGSSSMLYSKPSSVNNFYYGTDWKMTKMISPRAVKYFSERRFNY